MNNKAITFTAALALACTTWSGVRAEDLYDYKIPRESQDWCIITLRTKPANGADVPLVLLIGDSITVRYSTEVGTALRDKAYVSLLGTSKAVGDPALLDELKLVLRQNRYAVIHFNYGLHGGIEGYRSGFAAVLATIKQYAPTAKLIWATTTPCEKKDDAPEEGVIERNKIAAEHLVKAGIVVDDLYTLVATHPKKLWDPGGVHYTMEGTAMQSHQVAQTIVSLLPVTPARK